VLATVGIVTIISALLILGGLGLFGLTVWFWRTSRPEPPALARLEVMSERAYRKSKGVDRQFLLKIAHDEARRSNPTSGAADN
jgi:Trk-type K+ transport system membrane component